MCVNFILRRFSTLVSIIIPNRSAKVGLGNSGVPLANDSQAAANASISLDLEIKSKFERFSNASQAKRLCPI
jgi:hypothetical protein